MHCKTVLLIQSYPDLFGRIRTFGIGSGSKAFKIDIFLHFFVLKNFFNN
jgi:hypothetical protein